MIYERAKILKFCKFGFISTLKIILRTPENVSWYGGGGFRTHVTLADTLVFKPDCD